MTPAPLPAEEIERLKTLLEKATPGDWLQDDDLLQTRDGDIVIAVYPDEDCPRGAASFDDNMSFVAAAKSALPALLAEIEAGRAGAERVPVWDDEQLARAICAAKGIGPDVLHQNFGGEPEHGRMDNGKPGHASWWRQIERGHVAVLRAALRQAAQPSNGAQRIEVDERGTLYARLVWALMPGRPQIVAVCTSDGAAERYRSAVETQHRGAVFHVERVPLDHHFGSRDIQSMIYRAVSAAPAQAAAQPAGRVEPTKPKCSDARRQMWPREKLCNEPYSWNDGIPYCDTCGMFRQSVHATPPASGAVGDGEIGR